MDTANTQIIITAGKQYRSELTDDLRTIAGRYQFRAHLLLNADDYLCIRHASLHEGNVFITTIRG